MKPLNLIIVEDSAKDVALITGELKRGGFKPVYRQVKNAASLKEALQDEKCQVIISCLGLPRFSSAEALKLLKQSGRDLPFIIVSGVTGEDAAVAAIKAGVHDYIMKNNLARLVPIVERALKETAARKERKKAGEALIESEARFRRIMETTKDIIYRIDFTPALHFAFISPAVTEILGFKPEEFYADPALIDRFVHPAQDQGLVDFIKSAPLSNQPLLLKVHHKSGHPVWLELWYTPIYGEKSEILALEGIVRDITKKIQREEKLQESYNQIQALSKRILTAMEEERARLARELHDELGQVLTAVKLDLQLLEAELNPDKTREQLLKQSIALIDHTINLVRRQSVSLRPPQLDDMGLFAALTDMFSGFKKRTGLEGDFIYENNADRYPTHIETALYRCVQESLTNIARHAGASRVDVTIGTTSENELIVKVIDDGIGFNHKALSTSPDHIGLTGMRERVKLLGGRFSIDSEPGQGTAVCIAVPCLNNTHGGLTDHESATG